MVWSPSAIYSAVHIGGYRVAELRISDAVMEKALKGQENYKQKISVAFRESFKKSTGIDPGWIDFNYIVFTKVRDVPAPKKKGKK